MARRRNWSLATQLELCVRHSEFEQNAREISDALPLTLGQVHYYLRHEDTTLGPNQQPAIQVYLDEIRARVQAELGSPHANPASVVTLPRTPRLPKPTKVKMTQEQQTELLSEVEGCIDLVRQAASQFGITPRRFLHLCMTNARSAQ